MKKVVDIMCANDIVITYGQTESSPGITNTTTDDPLELRVSTVGRTLPDVEMKIVDPETGKEVGCHTQGEICARGYNIMKGYYKMPEATASAIDKEGWLHTGDLGTVDENGYLKITGRLKDMIIRGGENIYPREIEEMLEEHPAVKETAVVGVPHPVKGQVIKAYIILEDGCAADKLELFRFLKDRLALYKIPEVFVYKTELPRGASGKILKRMLD